MQVVGRKAKELGVMFWKRPFHHVATRNLLVVMSAVADTERYSEVL